MAGDCEGSPPSKRIRGVLGEIVSSFSGLTPMAGNSLSCDTETLGSDGQISKLEFVRVINQALVSLGYQNAARVLEEDSGVPLQSPVVSQFCNEILNGKWDESVTNLKTVGPLEAETLKAASYLILQQKFLEFLERGDVDGALKTLRTEISPLQIYTKRVHDLSMLFLCSSREELLANAGWRGAGLDSRQRLLEELQEVLPPSLMVPKKRLEHLVDQALT